MNQPHPTVCSDTERERLARQIVAASPGVPNAERYFNYLCSLKPPALQERLHTLRSEADRFTPNRRLRLKM